MKYLLDTQVLLWYMNGDARLPEAMLKIIDDKNNLCFVGIASIWEIAIKSNIGKLKLKSDFNRIEGFITRNEFVIHPIEFR